MAPSPQAGHAGTVGLRELHLIEPSKWAGERWKVHKFGGSSLADARCFKQVVRILSLPSFQNESLQAVVVSAMSGVTDSLLNLVSLAKNRQEIYLEQLVQLRNRHEETARSLLGDASSELNSFLHSLHSDCEDLRELLRGVWLMKSDPTRIVELVASYGEIWSAQLLCATLRTEQPGARWLDARQVLITRSSSAPSGSDLVASAPAIIWDRSRLMTERWLWANPTQRLVITGFIASREDGATTTLKRNGSDYSASIFGALLRAESITIWTDVDGILSADPRLVPEAVSLPELSYQEATELAYFGAKVVHPATMAPAISLEIPIRIRNTFRPEAHGTLIHSGTTESSQPLLERGPVQGFATIDSVALINVEGTGMMGVPGIAERLFGSLKEVGVSVIMISQASSEHSICFAIPAAQAALAQRTVEQSFFAELQQGLIQKVEISPDSTILAAVGDGMANRPGVAARFFESLARARVNVRAIAQGSSERNISAVIPREDSARALRAVHSGFFLSDHTLSIGVIGTGRIGSALLRQLQEISPSLKAEKHIDLRVRAIANSRLMQLGDGITPGADPNMGLDPDALVAHVSADHLPHAVLIDCTSSESVAKRYPEWLRQGIHVITPNKKANTMDLAFYRALKDTARSSRRHYLYETTVGAGLPVINTLRDLIQTGDRVLEIEGVLSGTLGYLFNTFSPELSFTRAVLDAWERGYTEPDPRDDLSGSDVARKLVILAREIGLEIELKDVQVESLVPETLRTGGVDHFLRNLQDSPEARHWDAQMHELLSDAADQGECLRYVGQISLDGQAKVALKRYSRTHSFSRLQGTDNIVAFRTERYHTQPLVVQGPGAGPEVTAAGVFADLLRLCSYLGASP